MAYYYILLQMMMRRDIVNVGSKIIGKKLELKKVPNIAIKDVEVYVVPVATSIGSFFYDEGLNFKGTVKFPTFFLPRAPDGI